MIAGMLVTIREGLEAAPFLTGLTTKGSSKRLMPRPRVRQANTRALNHGQPG
jgi:hypothetical protein